MLHNLSFLLWGYFLFSTIQTSYTFKSPTVKLSDGNNIPVVGFGTHFRSDTDEVAILLSALDNGYRLFDTAYVYYNERIIGEALKQWFAQGGKREEVFISTKLPTQAMRPADVETYMNASLANLGLDYLDLYLIHVPFGCKKNAKMGVSIFENGTFEIDPTTDHVAIWKEMEKQVKAGRIKSIGLSNFNETQILKVYNNAEIKPSNLQVELNLYLQQQAIFKLCRELNIYVTAYSPLGSNDLVRLRRRRSIDRVSLPPPTRHPLVQKVANKYKKSTAQILLRFNVQNGALVIPKSRNPNRQKENLNIFDFSLTKEDMARLRTLDQHGKVRKFKFLTFLGVKNHPEYPFTNWIK